jgi:tripartite-type tricarboxylate transporter receptor subunit TctC
MEGRMVGQYRHRVGGLLAAACLALWPISAAAQGDAVYPDRPIRLIVGYPPGGPNDLIARIIAPKLADTLKQPVIVENRPGSNSEIAAALVAKATPDGYTLLFASSGAISISPGLGRQLPYDARRDFVPVSIVASGPMLLVVKPDLPAQSPAELIGLARARPGTLNAASAGSGSSPHLALELFRAMAKIDVLHVPYRGAGPAFADLIAGQVDFYFGGLPTALPQVRAGKLRALAVTGASRSSIAPEIPTLQEAVLPGYDASIWYGVFAPAGTPAAIVAKLHAAVLGATRDGDVRRQFATHGADPLESPREAFVRFIAEDIDKWTRIVREAGIKVD